MNIGTQNRAHWDRKTADPASLDQAWVFTKAHSHGPAVWITTTAAMAIKRQKSPLSRLIYGRTNMGASYSGLEIRAGAGVV